MINSRLVRGALLLAIVLMSACRPTAGPGIAPAPSSALFEAGLSYVALNTPGWTLRVDPRWMNRAPTASDVQRDAQVAPTPGILEGDPLLPERVAMLDGSGIPQDRIDEYAACTRYLGGTPPAGPEPRAGEADVEGERRGACASRRADAAAIFGRPRQLPANGPLQRWSMRVYILTPASREVSDLILVPTPDGWTVTRSIELMKITS